MHPVVYAHTRTQPQYTADVQAWVASWAVPAQVLMGGGGSGAGSGRPTESAVNRQQERVPKRFGWMRPSRAGRVSFYDMDEMDTPEALPKVKGALAGAFARRKTRRVA